MFFDSIISSFYKTLVLDNRWMFYIKGMGNTLLMSAIACLMGVVIGFLIASVKVAYANGGRLRVLNSICNFYTTIIRGTPVLVQLLITYYIIFKYAPPESAIFIAAMAFGINSGAYVSEVIRAGIMSIDKGQTEAGRSLGLTQKDTMRLIVLPQAIKNILPALFNEFISLLKETSVAGWIAVLDITRAGDVIRSREPTFAPLLVSAALYLALVLGLTKVQQVIERRLSASDKR